MIITRKYALSLIRAGKARFGKSYDTKSVWPPSTTDNGRSYVIVERLDLQRTDHYLKKQ